MAKAEVRLTCKTCGKTFTWSKICGSRTATNKAEEWATNNIEECSECRFKTKIEHENIQAREMSEEMKLPQLEGSAKQIEWAETIRAKFIGSYDNFKNSSNPRSKKICKLFEELIQKETTAKFWIDHRYDMIEDLTIDKD